MGYTTATNNKMASLSFHTRKVVHSYITHRVGFKFRDYQTYIKKIIIIKKKNEKMGYTNIP